MVRGESKISTLESSRTIFRITGSLLQIHPPGPPSFFPIPLQLHLTSSLIITSLSLYLSGVVSNHSLAQRAKKNVCKPQKEPFRVVTKDKTVTSQTEAFVMIRHCLSAIDKLKSICSKLIIFFHTFQIRYQIFLCSSWRTARSYVNAALQHLSRPAAPPN